MFFEFESLLYFADNLLRSTLILPCEQYNVEKLTKKGTQTKLNFELNWTELNWTELYFPFNSEEKVKTTMHTH